MVVSRYLYVKLKVVDIDTQRSRLFSFGYAVLFFWIIGLVVLALLTKIDRKYLHYSSFIIFSLIFLSLLFHLFIEVFLWQWLRKNSVLTQKEKGLFLLELSTPYYIGSIWLILLPFMTIKVFLNGDFDGFDYIDLWIKLIPLLGAWITFVICLLQTISCSSLKVLLKKIEEKGKLALSYSCLFILFILTTSIFVIEFLEPLKKIISSALTEANVKEAFNQSYIGWRASNNALPCVALITFITTHALFTSKLSERKKWIMGLTIRVIFIALAVMAMVFPNTGGFGEKKWPFNFTEIPNWSYWIPGFRYIFSASLMNEVYFFPMIWLAFLFFWSQIQQKKRVYEVGFRILAPLAICLLPQAIYLFQIQYSTSFFFAFFGALAVVIFFIRDYLSKVIARDYLSGIRIIWGKLYCEGDKVALLKKNIKGTVINIGYFSTEIKISEELTSLSIPNHTLVSSLTLINRQKG